ncbi:MAG: hypothetical protein QN178_10005 [Armatimonadota bacterium]|nr:hypothetical protein [Armatimonadota bacterium]
MCGSSFADLRAAARFLWSLPAYLRRPLSREEAAAIVRRRLTRREADFLDLIDRAVYANPQNPYCKLLALAGCEPGDLKALVKRDGVEGALTVLFRHGVYLTVDEFKGRKAVRRGSTVLQVNPADLRMPWPAAFLPAQTSGSGGAPITVVYDMATIRDRAVNACLALDAQGGGGWVKAVWGVSTGSAPVVLRFGAFGPPVAKWFLQVSPRTPGIHRRYRWVGPALRVAALAGGVGFPRPELASINDPSPVARWMAATLRGGQIPYLYTFASSAVRLCQAARDAGISIAGARFTITGEPVTAARRAVFGAVAADVAADYGSVDAGGPVSHSCLSPVEPDDVHFFHDLHAVIQPGTGPGHALPPRALLLTSLRAASPFVLLNVSLGDQAFLERRRCGCPLEALGWDLHFHTIRSFEKLTAGGMTFLDADVVRILEDELPARFGGGPADYQLVEEEVGAGVGIVLAVHPGVGPLDKQAVRSAFLDAIGRGSGAERIMALQWREAGLPRVERRAPVVSGRGKVLHVWRARATEPEPSMRRGGGHE